MGLSSGHTDRLVQISQDLLVEAQFAGKLLHVASLGIRVHFDGHERGGIDLRRHVLVGHYTYDRVGSERTTTQQRSEQGGACRCQSTSAAATQCSRQGAW